MVYEGFNYPAGSSLSNYSGTANQGMVNPNGSVWQTAGPTNATAFISINPPTLTVGDVGGTGNAVQLFGSAGDASRLPIGPFFGPATGSNTVYYSTALQVTNYANLFDQTSGTTGAGPGNRGLVLGFNTVGPTQTGIPSVAGTRLYLRQGTAPDTFQFGFSKNSLNAGQYVFDTTDYPLFDSNNNPITYFVVGSYTLNGGSATNDDAAMWINPDPSTFSVAPPTPTFSTVSLGTGTYQPATDGADLSTNSIQSLLLINKGQTGQTSGFSVDEIRVDSTWAGVTPVPGSTYTGGTTGTWSSANWSTSSDPSASGATVNFPQQSSAATVTLSSAETVGILNLNSSNGYTLNGAGPLTLSGSPTINVTAGSHTISTSVSVTSNLEVNTNTGATLNITSDTTYASGVTLTKTGGGTLTVKNVRADAINILGQGSTLQIAPNGTNTGVSVVKTLAIPTITSSAASNPQLAPVSKLDLTNNTLIYDYTGTSPLGTSLSGGASPAVHDLLVYGYDAGHWDGTGIVSSTAAADPHQVTTIGYAESSVLLGASGGQFAGQTVDSTSLILKTTYYGDINLDGKIDGDDYALLDRSFAKGTFATSGANWTDGDFNYDGKVDSADYALIDKAFGVQQGGFSPDFLSQRAAEFGDAYVSNLLASVPEPTSFALLSLVGLGLSSRRRMRK
jgi:hypothetical protein